MLVRMRGRERTFVVLASAALAACTREPPAVDSASASSSAATVERRAIDPTSVHALRGVVRLEGQAPARVPMDIEGQGGCHARDARVQLTEDAIVTDGRVANVLVWVKSGHERWIAPASESDELHLDQEGCMYRPRVSGMRLGAVLRVKNSDPTNHNVNVRAVRNEGSNQVQAPGSPDVAWKPAKREVPVSIECNAHPWMRAWVGVFDHPWFAVSALDGTFELRGLPPGEYELDAWHEVFGRASASARVPADADGAVEIVMHGGR
jgi:hypothetical protein